MWCTRFPPEWSFVLYFTFWYCKNVCFWWVSVILDGFISFTCWSTANGNRSRYSPLRDNNCFHYVAFSLKMFILNYLPYASNKYFHYKLTRYSIGKKNIFYKTHKTFRTTSSQDSLDIKTMLRYGFPSGCSRFIHFKKVSRHKTYVILWTNKICVYMLENVLSMLEKYKL